MLHNFRSLSPAGQWIVAVLFALLLLAGILVYVSL